MNWLGVLRQKLRWRARQIGPGRLVLVVGPSGAGKDTLIALAQERCAREPDIVFPHRIVTRSVSAFENHASMTEAEFERVRIAGGFALHWRAHGLSYGVLRSIDDDIRAGRMVICNISRSVVETARACYARVAVVMITALPHLLALRLAQRGRESEEAIAERLARNIITDGAAKPDVVIANGGLPESSAMTLIDVICDRLPVPY